MVLFAGVSEPLGVQSDQRPNIFEIVTDGDPCNSVVEQLSCNGKDGRVNIKVA